MNTRTDEQTVTQAAEVTGESLFGVKAAAIDLYERGFNVFPVPPAYEWRNRAVPGDENKKPPFDEGSNIKALELLHITRLHYCGCLECRHVKPGEDLISLFERTNIAVMTGRTSGNLIALDCDTQEAFQVVGRELARRALSFWAITGKRGGTYFLRVVEGEVKNGKGVGRYKDVEILGNNKYAILPPSVHPVIGYKYEWGSG